MMKELNSTSIAIETDSLNQNDFVVLDNGEFEIAYYQLINHYDNPETPVEERFYLYLKDKDFEHLNPYSYGISSETEVLVIKDYRDGDYLNFESSFGFDNQNYSDQISLNYDTSNDQTIIDLETGNYNKNSFIIIDGHLSQSSLNLNNGHLQLTLSYVETREEDPQRSADSYRWEWFHVQG